MHCDLSVNSSIRRISETWYASPGRILRVVKADGYCDLITVLATNTKAIVLLD